MWRLLLLSFIWGWSFLLIKVAGEGMTPVTVAWLRLALGALALVVIARVRGLRLPSGRARWRTLAIAAVLGNAVPFTLLAWSTQHISTGLTAVLNASTPLFTAVAAATYLHERLRALQAFGLLLGFVGVGVAAGFGTADLTGSSWLGALAAVGAGACYGAAFAFMRRNLIDIPPLAAATGQLLVGAAIMAPLGIGTSMADGFDPTPTRVLAVVLLGVFGTGIAYILNYRLLAEIGATKTSLTTYIVPVVAVVLGVVVLDESFSLRILAGGVLIALGIALVNERIFGPRRRVPAAAPTAAMIVLALALVVAGCAGDDDDGSSLGEACEPVRTEALDPSSGQHVLSNAPEPTYLSDPPTSGPHQPGRLESGVVDEPLSRPVQVGILEAGQILVQHTDDLDTATTDDLVALGADVVVAPNPDLPAPIVATAWRHKLECQEVELSNLRDFVDSFAGGGAGNH
jgi:drug/metabolite transporter (DMT)-like permease